MATYTEQQQAIFTTWFQDLVQANVSRLAANQIATAIATGRELCDRQQGIVNAAEAQA